MIVITTVILSNAKNLLSVATRNAGEKQILRFAQDDTMILITAK